MKSLGSVFSQVLINKLNAIGMLMLIPRIFAFNAVQRQIAASRSNNPPNTEQHGVLGGFPIIVPMLPFSKPAHTRSFRASLGQLPMLGFGIGFGSGFGTGGVLQPLTITKNKRLTRRKRTADGDFREFMVKYFTSLDLN
ncbi:hypothetical protein ACJIZ3_004109 [Penstemon smallii]|uniref:Uncharacterized protein n=1 Tax=Penstemon smallii TaxID=265156 RepID=A0ABD3S147_9LAMI